MNLCPDRVQLRLLMLIARTALLETYTPMLCDVVWLWFSVVESKAERERERAREKERERERERKRVREGARETERKRERERER